MSDDEAPAFTEIEGEEFPSCFGVRLDAERRVSILLTIPRI